MKRGAGEGEEGRVGGAVCAPRHAVVTPVTGVGVSTMADDVDADDTDDKGAAEGAGEAGFCCICWMPGEMGEGGGVMSRGTGMWICARRTIRAMYRYTHNNRSPQPTACPPPPPRIKGFGRVSSRVTRRGSPNLENGSLAELGRDEEAAAEQLREVVRLCTTGTPAPPRTPWVRHTRPSLVILSAPVTSSPHCQSLLFPFWFSNPPPSPLHLPFHLPFPSPALPLESQVRRAGPQTRQAEAAAHGSSVRSVGACRGEQAKSKGQE